MLEETLVLDCNERIQNNFGNVVNIHPNAVLVGVQSLQLNLLAVLVVAVDKCGEAKLNVLKVNIEAAFRKLHYINGQRRCNNADSDYYYQKHRKERCSDNRQHAADLLRTCQGVWGFFLLFLFRRCFSCRFKLFIADFYISYFLFIVHIAPV